MKYDINLMEVLPTYFRPVIEFRQLMDIDGLELGRLEENIDRIRDNCFIQTCDEATLAYYEGLLQVEKETGLSLDERRAVVLMRYSMRALYTFPMLKEMLTSAVGKGNYLAECLYGTYQLKIRILNQDIGLIKSIYNVIAFMRPAHIVLLVYAEFREECSAEVTYSERVEFITSFYPRFNLPALLLDNTWKLDGSRRLNGINTETPVDLYPVSAGFRPSVSAKVLDGRRFCFKGSAYVPTKTGAQNRVEMSARQQTTALECLEVAAEARQDIGAGTITVHNQNILSSSWKLDGSRKLNGGIYIR